jgi:hypothetical protein
MVTAATGPGAATPPGRSGQRRRRAELAGIADEAARIGVRLHEHPHATDVGTWLEGLGTGVDQARKAAWIPVAYRLDESPATEEPA